MEYIYMWERRMIEGKYTRWKRRGRGEIGGKYRRWKRGKVTNTVVGKRHRMGG